MPFPLELRDPRCEVERMVGTGVLIIDDDPALSAVVKVYLGALGVNVDVADSASAGLAATATGDHDCVLLDLGLPDGGGVEVLRKLRDLDAGRPVIILTADSNVDSVVVVMRDGAWDYIVKPVDRTKLLTTVRNAIERRRLVQRIDVLSRNEAGAFYGIVGASSVMRALFAQIERVARSEVTVAIRGESGSGKELVARALHDAGPRKGAPFIAINCAAIPESLQESELFGHEKGSFTGAFTKRVGRLEQADGGTLFLDEVAELPLSLQAKLLRCLQEKKFSRIGGSTELSTNFRLVTATHKDLVHEVAAGRFREDLYYRLAVFDLDIAPLRSRREDIPLLAHHFLQQQRGADGQVYRLDPDALHAMMEYGWRGNVRELQNAIYHALVVANDGVIRAADLPPRVLHGAQPVRRRFHVPQPDGDAPVSAEGDPVDAPAPAMPTPTPVRSADEPSDEHPTPSGGHDRAAPSVNTATADWFPPSLSVPGLSPRGGEPAPAPSQLRTAAPLPSRPMASAPAVAPTSMPPEQPMTLEALERRAIEDAIRRLGGNMSAVAKELGMGRTTLYRKLQAFGLRGA